VSSTSHTLLSVHTISTSSTSSARSPLSSSPHLTGGSQTTTTSISFSSTSSTTSAETGAIITPAPTTSSKSTNSSGTQPPVTSFDSASVSSFVNCLQSLGHLGVCDRNYDGGIPEWVDHGAVLSFAIFNPYYPINLGVLSPTTLDDTGRYCSSSWGSSLLEWMATAPVSVATVTGDDVILITGVGAPIGTTHTADSWIRPSYYTDFTWSPGVPCCSSCTVFGGEIKVCESILGSCFSSCTCTVFSHFGEQPCRG
jgi:hypothetical protein